MSTEQMKRKSEPDSEPRKKSSNLDQLLHWDQFCEVESRTQRFLTCTPPKHFYCDEEVPAEITAEGFEILGFFNLEIYNEMNSTQLDELRSDIESPGKFKVNKLYGLRHPTNEGLLYYVRGSEDKDDRNSHDFFIFLSAKQYMIIGNRHNHAYVYCNAFEYQNSDGSSPDLVFSWSGKNYWGDDEEEKVGVEEVTKESIEEQIIRTDKYLTPRGVMDMAKCYLEGCCANDWH